MSLGFEYPLHQTTPDFLTAIIVPDLRCVKFGKTPPPPLDPAGLADTFQKSDKFS